MSQVIFDGINRLMICKDDVDTLNVKLLYSDWKRWVLESDNSKYLPAFFTVGGETTISDSVIEPYFFLINGWRIRPREEDHQLIIDGLIFSDNQDNIVAPTVGGYSVTIFSMVPSLTATTMKYGEIQRQAIEDMIDQFFTTVLQYNDFQKQTIRDALLLNPSPNLDPSIHSVENRLERIDMNTQIFGDDPEKQIKINMDTTHFDNKVNMIGTKIDQLSSTTSDIYSSMVVISDKTDTFNNRLQRTYDNTEDILNKLLEIKNSIDSL